MYTDLRDPCPRSAPHSVEMRKRPIVHREFLANPTLPEEQSCAEVFRTRKSRRAFGHLDRADLSALLWLAAKSRYTKVDASGVRRQSRPYPSGGGIHAVDLLLVEQVQNAMRCAWYNPVSHALDFPIVNSASADVVYQRANQIVPVGSGTVLWFVADMERLNAAYVDCESLAWRDSGALLMSIYMASEVLGLSCCGVGCTGTNELNTAGIIGDGEIGVGGCIVGTRQGSE